VTKISLRDLAVVDISKLELIMAVEVNGVAGAIDEF
jgi:hypothetical protein